jgi:hypothetical protein
MLDQLLADAEAQANDRNHEVIRSLFHSQAYYFQGQCWWPPATDDRYWVCWDDPDWLYR